MDAVVVAIHLRVGVAEVQHHPAVVDGGDQAAHQLIGPDAGRQVPGGLGGVAAGGHAPDLGTRSLLAEVQQGVEMRHGDVDAVASAQLPQRPLADPGGAHERTQVTAHQFGKAAVGHEHVPDVAPEGSALVDPQRRDADGLLPDVGCLGVVAARRPAAEVGQVPLGGRPEPQLAVDEHRTEHAGVLGLVVAPERVVVHEDVAGPDGAPHLLHEVAQHLREPVRHQREPFVLGQDAMVRVQDGGGEITDLEKLGPGGALDDPGHVPGGGFDLLAQHRHQDRVDHGRSPAAPRLRYSLIAATASLRSNSL